MSTATPERPIQTQLMKSCSQRAMQQTGNRAAAPAATR
ncbi:hypothetical protein SALBM311S_02742 [Streptomyces alboniger]